MRGRHNAGSRTMVGLVGILHGNILHCFELGTDIIQEMLGAVIAFCGPVDGLITPPCPRMTLLRQGRRQLDVPFATVHSAESCDCFQVGCFAVVQIPPPVQLDISSSIGHNIAVNGFFRQKTASPIPSGHTSSNDGPSSTHKLKCSVGRPDHTRC